MKNKPIYVEIDMKTDMECLWQQTQTPNLHQQWDLRFSEIDYLPREDEGSPQALRYRTRIGFGLAISGTGVAQSSSASADDVRMSTLAFESGQAVSLIRQGAGYWKYTPHADHITFATRYDYQTRFGAVGAWFDRVIFRPLFGYATAWSFDLLRIWLERGIPPAFTIRRALTHYMSVALLCMLWLYEGLVPKLIYPFSGELVIMQQTGWFPGREHMVLPVLGVFEMVIGILMLRYHRMKPIYVAQSLLLFLLAAAALIGNPASIIAPLNPFTLSGPMIGLCLAAYWTSDLLPHAGRCKR